MFLLVELLKCGKRTWELVIECSSQIAKSPQSLRYVSDSAASTMENKADRQFQMNVLGRWFVLKKQLLSQYNETVQLNQKHKFKEFNADN